MDRMIHASQIPVDQLLAACEIKRTRAGGPGGQHRNKVETAIVIRHLPTGVTGQASERRSQQANRLVAILRLRINLAIQIRCQSGPEAELSELWLKRTGQGRRRRTDTEAGDDRQKSTAKIAINPNHDDFPALLAEAMDVVWAENLDLPAAARRLGVSKTQLQKLLKMEHLAWEKLNSDRQTSGLHRLK